MLGSASRSFLISIPTGDFNLNQLLSQTGSLTEPISPRYFQWQNASTPRTTSGITSYPIPKLLVGTINTLMLLSDDLIKLDNACKSTVLAIERQGKELYQKQYKDVTVEQLASWSYVDSNRTMLDYFMGFQWAEQKYPKGYPLQELANLIKGKVNKMDDDLKHFQQNYQEKRALKSVADRSGKGNLLVKDLSMVLEVESRQERTVGTSVVGAGGRPLQSSDFLDTQFMKTVVVVIPATASKDFEKNYHTLGNPEEEDKNIKDGGGGGGGGGGKEESVSLLGAPETKNNGGGSGGEIMYDGAASSLPCSPVVPGSLLKVTSDDDTILYLMTVVKSQQERVSRMKFLMLGSTFSTCSLLTNNSFVFLFSFHIQDFRW